MMPSNVDLRPRPSTEPVIRAYHIELNRRTREVRSHGELVHLTPMEFHLLLAFMTHQNQVLPNAALTRNVLDSEWPRHREKLRAYVSRLRSKLDDPHRILIRNVHGIGYRLTSRPR